MEVHGFHKPSRKGSLHFAVAVGVCVRGQVKGMRLLHDQLLVQEAGMRAIAELAGDETVAVGLVTRAPTPVDSTKLMECVQNIAH